MQSIGYNTSFLGKYLNNYGYSQESLSHVPVGWDNWYGLKGNVCVVAINK